MLRPGKMTKTVTACFIALTGMGIIGVTAGCESGQAQNMRVEKVETRKPADSEESQREYDDMIAARTRQVSGRFSQVSLFGELPAGTAQTQEQGQPGKALQQHTFATEGECFDPRVSPDGKWLVYASTQHTLKPEIYIKPINSTAITQLTNNPASDVQPVFSQDSRRLAFSSDRTGNWDIFVVDLDGRNIQQLTDDTAPEMHPSFSPDGSKLAYCRLNVRNKQWEIWMLDMSNPGQRKFIAPGLFPNFSPVENKIVYQRSCQRGSQLFSIWTISLTQDDQPSAPTEIVSTADRALIGPKWSADGKKIAYCSVVPGEKDAAPVDAQVWIIQPNGQGKMPMTDPGFASFSPTWGTDGRIYFCANRGSCENIWSVAPAKEEASSATAQARPAPREAAGAQAEARQYHTDPVTTDIRPNHPVQLKTGGNGTVEVRE
jgi:TolB protein